MLNDLLDAPPACTIHGDIANACNCVYESLKRKMINKNISLTKYIILFAINHSSVPRQIGWEDKNPDGKVVAAAVRDVLEASRRLHVSGIHIKKHAASQKAFS